jgi:hypothetical protein
MKKAPGEQPIPFSLLLYSVWYEGPPVEQRLILEKGIKGYAEIAQKQDGCERSSE